MKRLLSIPSYLWAIICMLLIPVTFIGNDYFAHQFARLPFMKISPIYSGGEFARNYKQDSLDVTINKPVFESLIGSSSEGFVQVKFSGVKKLPDLIQKTIDYDNDGKADFNVNINTSTGETKIDALSEYVYGLEVSSKVKDYWVVRIKVVNKDKK